MESTLATLLGRFHGAWWESEAAGVRRLAAITERVARPVLSLSPERLQTFGRRHADLMSEELVDTLSTVPDRLAESEQVLADGPTTLTHRDLHLDNVLFVEGDQPYVLDWQSAAPGPPSVDVGRLLTECLTFEQQEEYGDAVIPAYLDSLRDAGIDRSVSEVRREVALVAIRGLVGTINWLGRSDAPASGTRAYELGRNSVQTCLATVGSFHA